MATDSLLRDIEHLSRINPVYREIFTEVVEFAKARFAEQVKQKIE